MGRAILKATEGGEGELDKHPERGVSTPVDQGDIAGEG